ncbi:MAG: MurR/RpiR family transcriptional regulator [Anaerolineae bacterium]
MILERLRQVYPHLSKSQRKLADFVSHCYVEAAFMTASGLARRLSVNEATVIRFAQRLGYCGYPDLARDIRALVRKECGASGASAASSEQPLAGPVGAQIEALERIPAQVSTDAARRAVEILHGARRIHVCGGGAAACVAGLLAGGLCSLGIDARCLSADAEVLAQALVAMDDSHVVVAVVTDRDNPLVTRALAAARRRGARTLVLSTCPVASAARVADLALVCSVGAESGLSPLVAAGLSQALIQALADARQGAVGAAREILDQALAALQQPGAGDL